MGSIPDLTGARWRKSSYSADTGGECVECAPLGAAAWRKSSYSGNTGGQCVEVSPQPCRVAVRDSKNPDGPAFAVAPAAFTAFVTAAKRSALGG
ncbi:MULTISPECIES: DUF397 domain-containing protein [Streptomyces]|uniref:DUF397 domain-containing protein n=1 Tax=Streptomyces chengmaiensis TaxID=3040919 RepID=A0ABT6HXX6_9ACTN|nr:MULTISPECIES: DUF397 domain-containing protein [Streptomyces]MDH2393167.1 DUF397 domain-containing protein [Streptomyces chengmaiensis]WRQ79201.1 DUF397 domain-containing protein [Streptomyces sp. MUM 178J]